MKIQAIDLKDIVQNENSRAVYKQTDLVELMASMKQDGLLQPVGVRRIPGGKFEAVFGNRRIMAAKKLAWSEIPAHILEDTNDADLLILNLVENFKRQGTTVAEDGRIFQLLIDMGLTKSEIAVRLGITPNRVSLGLEVVGDVPKDIQKRIVNKLPGRKAKAGMIPAQTANAVLHLRRSEELTRKQTSALMEFAAKDGIGMQHIRTIAPLMKQGLTVSMAAKAAAKYRRVNITLLLDREATEALEKREGQSITDIVYDYIAQDRRFKVAPKLVKAYESEKSEARA